MNRRRTIRTLRGFTLVELMITAVITSVVVLTIGAVIVDGQSSWNAMYDRLNSDVVTDGYVARKKFDSVMRRTSDAAFVVGSDGSWIETYYYADDSSPAVDRYARFYVAEGSLLLEYGELGSAATLSVETVCTNISQCTFKVIGRSVEMLLTLNNGTQENTIVSSAVPQLQ
ncbi:MAG: prepilin-type N-terminal cleavage/methylation domain-containing protein [Sedimentisphaerales bacterium]